MLKILKRLLVPTRFDACILVIVIHWIIVIVFTVVFSDLAAIVYAAGTTWLAIAATIGWRANSNRRMVLLLISSIASLGFVVGWFYLNTDLFVQLPADKGRRNSQIPFDADQFLYASWALGYLFLASLAVWVANWIARRFIGSIKNPISWLGQKFKNNRTRVLLVVAGILFFMAIGSRGASSLELIGDSDSVGSMAFFGLSVVGFVLHWAIFLFWFPRSMVLDGKPVQKIASLAVVLVFFIPIVFNAFQTYQEFLTAGPLWLGSGLIFVLSVIGIGGEQSKNRVNSDQAGIENARIGGIVSHPTLFSLLSVLLLAVVIAIPRYVDVAVFAMPHFGKNTFSEQLELAVESARVNRESGGKIKLYFDEYSRVTTWKVQFDSDSSPQLLDALGKPGSFNSIEFTDLDSSFDLSAIKGNFIGVTLVDCKISHTQLNDILASGQLVQVVGEFAIENDGAVIDPGALNSAGFRDAKPGAVASFFKAVKCEKQMTYLFLTTPAANEDWATVEEVSQTAHVYLHRGWADGFVMPKADRSLKNIHVYIYSEREKENFDKDVFLNTDIDFSFGGRSDSLENTWKLLIFRGQNDFYSHVDSIAVVDKTFEERAKEIGMAYQLNEDGTVESLYFPWGESERFVLPDLRVLSYDPHWVGIESMGGTGNLVDLGPLKLSPNLEELYLSTTLVPRDLAFLSNLKSLKHLQTPSVVRKVTGPVGFDACQTLESITFLGTPDNQSYREVAKLKSMKRLVIVNVDEEKLLTPEYRDKLAKKLPGVEVKILEPMETESLVPESFREYRDRMREEMREDTSWLDEILK